MVSRTTLVTGVCGGIGRAVAACFRSAGWTVIGTDRREPDADMELDRFELCDIGRDGEVADLFGRLADLGRLDALINNAAMQVNTSILETSDDAWKQVMDTNVRSAFQCVREAYPMLAAARGSVVNISSVHAVATSMNVAVYAISKGALAALTRSAAIELAAAGIRCNAVLPGAVDTDMLRDGLQRRPHPEGAMGNLRDLAARTPLGFVASPEQIAPSVLHLADGNLSPYTTGQMLVVDGGATIKLGTE